MWLRKIILLLMSLILAVALMVSCGERYTGSDELSEGDDTEETSQKCELLVSEIGKYSVVRGDNADDKEIEAAQLVLGALKDKLGIDVNIKTDFIKPGDPKYSAGEFEIIIGNTNREESAAFRESMRVDDYGYGMVGKKLIITGISSGGTYLAAEKFVADVVASHSVGDVLLSEEDDYIFSGRYALDSLALNGVQIYKYAIVYKHGESNTDRLLAGQLRDAIAAASGYLLDLYSDASDRVKEHEILFGVTSREGGSAYSHTLDADEYFIGTHGRQIILWSDSLEGRVAAIEDFARRISLLSASGGDAELSVGDAEILRVEVDMTISAMSFNVWVSNLNVERANRVITMVENYLPDLIGFQEASPIWMDRLRAGLSGYYSYVGEGRNGGNSGEYNPIFYRKDKFTLIESGTRWLSDTPERVSKYSESSLNRIFTYAVLKRNIDGRVFVHINTHFEHTSSVARVKQVTPLIDFAAGYSEYPVIMTGDFNCIPGSAEYKAIDQTYLVSSSDIALKKENAGATFHNYGSASKIIDFIFVSEDNVIVKLYRVASEKINGDYASDHHPVYIEVSLVG